MKLKITVDKNVPDKCRKCDVLQCMHAVASVKDLMISCQHCVDSHATIEARL